MFTAVVSRVIMFTFSEKDRYITIGWYSFIKLLLKQVSSINCHSQVNVFLEALTVWW